MPLTHYLIDSENLKRDWMLSVLKQPSNCRYHIFFTKNSPSIPVDVVKAMMEKGNHLEFIPCCTGSNALDFQLVSWMGYMLGTNPQDQYQIVSGDTGFDSVIHFWKERRVSISRIKDITSSQPTVKSTSELAPLCSSALYGSVEAEDINKAVAIIENALSSHAADYKNTIHTKLVKTFEQKKGSMIYNTCKSIITQAYENQLS